MAIMENLKSFLLKCSRVWQVMRKPNMQEFKTIAKVSGVGILVLGLIGFLIAIIVNIFR